MPAPLSYLLCSAEGALDAYRGMRTISTGRLSSAMVCRGGQPCPRWWTVQGRSLNANDLTKVQ